MSSLAQTPMVNTANQYLGAGAVYFNYGEADQLCVGATKGGSTFSTGREFKTSEQDGVYGPVKGLRKKIKVAPVLTINALEIHKENLVKFYAGMDVDTSNVSYDEVTERMTLTDADYITNVTFIGENGEGQDIIVILDNVLGDGNLEFAMTSNEEIVPSVQFTAHYDPSTPMVPPYRIRYTKA